MKMSKTKNLDDKASLSKQIEKQLQTLNNFFFDKKKRFSDSEIKLPENIVAEELDILLTKADKFLDLIQVRRNL
jgi:hypothetical protein